MAEFAITVTPDQVAQLAKWLFFTAASGAFVGAGGVSVLLGLASEVRWHLRANRRLRRLKRRVAQRWVDHG